MEKIRTGIVNYLNAKPLLYGLSRMPVRNRIELVPGYPSYIARLLQQGSIDLGLIPIAAIPSIPGARLVGNYCIGTNGDIATVALFSDVPLSEIKKILLDYQSGTSVALLRYLLKEHWQIAPEMQVAAGEEYLDEIGGSTAGLVIGDRAFSLWKKYPYCYDLGAEWKKFTGMPFVFAAWVSRRPLPEELIRMFDNANEEGLAHLDEIVADTPFALFDLKEYYTRYVSYRLDEEKRKAIEYFLQVIRSL